MTPKSWAQVPLGEVANLYQGFGFPKKLQGRDAGELGFYKVSDISRAVVAGNEHLGPAVHCISRAEAKALRATPLPKDSVVFARIGEAINLNRRALLPADALVDNNVIGTKARTGIEDRYLFYFLKTVKLGELSQATTVPAVRTSDIAAIKVPVAPTGEQKRIVSKLDELFSDIEEGERALERVQKLVERYRQSVLKAAVTGELTREWREKHKGPLESGDALLQRILKARREAWEKSELAKMAAVGKKPTNDHWKLKYEQSLSPTTDELPNLPPHWVWASVDQLTTKITSGSRDWKGFYGRGDSVFIMAQNIRPRRLDLSEIQRVDPPAGDRDASRSEVNQHDLLVTIVGANTGDICRVTEPLTKHYVCQSVALLRPVFPEAAPFVELFLCADEGGQAQFAKEAYGAGRPHLSFDQLRATCIPLPPLEEQVEICDAVNRIESDIKGMLAAAGDPVKVTNGLKQAVLRAAFSGTLVQQDATDEPASALLGRLRDHAPPSRNSPASAPAAPRPSRSRKS